MALDVGSLVAYLQLDKSGYTAGLKDADKEAQTFGERFSKSLENVSTSMMKIGGNLTKYVTLPLLAVGTAAVKSAADMEQFQASFEVMLGSAEKAQGFLAEIEEFSASTPFQMETLAQGAQTLLAFGIEAENVLPTMKLLGDVSLGNAQKFDSLTLAFAQVQSTGRLMGQDLLQMINAGFNPLKIIAEQTGEEMGVLKEKMSAGAISAQDVANAFAIAAGEGGQFHNALQKQSETLSGQFSTMLDNLKKAGREVVRSMVPAIKELVANITNWLKWFSSLDDGTKKLILKIAGLAAALGPVLSITGKLLSPSSGIVALAKSMTSLISPTTLVIGAVAGLAVGLGILIGKARKTREENNLLENALAGQAETADELQEALKILEKRYDKQNEFVKENAAMYEKYNARVQELEKFVKMASNGLTPFEKGLINASNTYKELGLNIEDSLNPQAQLNGLLEEALSMTNQYNPALNQNNEYIEKKANLESQLAEKVKEQNDLQAKAIRLELEQIQSMITTGGAIEKKGEIAEEYNKKFNQLVLDRISLLEMEREEALKIAEEKGEGMEEINKYYDELRKEAEEEKAEDDMEKREELLELQDEDREVAFEKFQIDLERKLQSLQLAGATEEQLEKFKTDKIEKYKREEDKKTRKEKIDGFMEYANLTLGIANDLFSALMELNNVNTQNALDNLDKEYKATISAIDSETQARLEAAGLTEETELERIQRELDEAIAAGDTETAAELEDELERTKIIQEGNDAKVAADEKYEKEKAQLEYKGEKAAWQLKLASSIASGAQAVLSGLSTQPFIPVGIAAGAAAGVAAGIQVAAVIKAKPQKPSFIRGGLAEMSEGGMFKGNPGIDTNAVNITSGEYIMNPASTSRFINDLEMMNKGVDPKSNISIAPTTLQIELDGNIIGQAVIEYITDQSDNGNMRINPKILRGTE